MGKKNKDKKKNPPDGLPTREYCIINAEKGKFPFLYIVYKFLMQYSS